MTVVPGAKDASVVAYSRDIHLVLIEDAGGVRRLVDIMRTPRILLLENMRISPDFCGRLRSRVVNHTPVQKRHRSSLEATAISILTFGCSIPFNTGSTK
jgi:hypothetical protein